jgi:hypothetical protein
MLNWQNHPHHEIRHSAPVQGEAMAVSFETNSNAEKEKPTSHNVLHILFMGRFRPCQQHEFTLCAISMSQTESVDVVLTGHTIEDSKFFCVGRVACPRKDGI